MGDGGELGRVETAEIEHLDFIVSQGDLQQADFAKALVVDVATVSGSHIGLAQDARSRPPRTESSGGRAVALLGYVDFGLTLVLTFLLGVVVVAEDEDDVVRVLLDAVVGEDVVGDEVMKTFDRQVEDFLDVIRHDTDDFIPINVAVANEVVERSQIVDRHAVGSRTGQRTR